jgi:membrane associated rhomboid family serine protease
MNLKLIIDFLSGSPVTFMLMLAVLLVSGLALFRMRFFGALMLHPNSIVKNKEYYRLLTADFVHNDILHLALNELTLYVFGSGLEEHLKLKGTHGSLQFLFIYFVSLLAAGIITTARHWKDFDYSTTGASGSIMGCMFGLLLLDPKGSGMDLVFVGPVENIYAGLFYIIFLILYQKRKGEVNYEIHFFGALGGIAATLMLFPGILQTLPGINPAMFH